MLIRAEKPITKEQYDRAQDNHGYITEEDMPSIFTESEICGYGIINPVACVMYNFANDSKKYFVRYETSNSCD